MEVLRHMSLYLDRTSASRLSRTCKALRDAGEIKVWEEIDLTSGWNRMFPSILSFYLFSFRLAV